MKALALVFLGGGLGSSLRYLISKYATNKGLPIVYGTFAVNCTGSLLMGFLLGFFLKSNTLSQSQILFLVTGFCGGFTTFSAFAHENQTFLRNGDYTGFAVYTIASVVVCIAAAALGVWLVKWL